MKKLLCAWLTVLMLFNLSLFVWAVPTADPSDKLYDYAGLLFDDDKMKLTKELQTLSETSGWDVVVVLIDDNEGYSSAVYADDFYDYNGFSSDGLLLLINMDDREVYISTCGAAIHYFTDGIIDDMTYELVEPLGDGDYAAAVSLFIQQVQKTLAAPPQGQSSSVSNSTPPIYEASEEQLDWEDWMITSVLVSVVLGGIVVAVMAGTHNKLPNKTQTTFHYVSDGRVNMNVNRDVFINSTVHKTRIQQNNSSNSGGRSHSHSTVHRSSSGRMHGGGGRKF